MGFRGDHTKMCHSGMWIILSWKQARLKRFRKNCWTSPLLLKEYKIEGLFQEVALTIDDYRKVCTQWHREEPAAAAAAAAKSLQSCPTLCDPIDSSPLGSAVPGILQARILEWVAIPFSSACKWKVKVKSLSHVRLLTSKALLIKVFCVTLSLDDSANICLQSINSSHLPLKLPY